MEGTEVTTEIKPVEDMTDRELLEELVYMFRHFAHVMTEMQDSKMFRSMSKLLGA